MTTHKRETILCGKGKALLAHSALGTAKIHDQSLWSYVWRIIGKIADDCRRGCGKEYEVALGQCIFRKLLVYGTIEAGITQHCGIYVISINGVARSFECLCCGTTYES